ncbi:MBL fold metallo-hydrolase [Thermococcus sp. 2319x1]|uniref:MBL fold metallo-hydrolase n=1 Tax=Thermococcus sp. 2319x1 TaxID=1674923 RepID=UPI001583AFF4|nr:MBL fold metallo-hydrolase [Thermococcus sp. 2319x1]
MKIVPLASESLGVRSLATFLEVGKVGILIDPGAALGPKRYSLPPAKAELEALQKAREKIQRYSKKARIITISHYHYDHHTPFFEGIYESSSPEKAKELYTEKILLIKHPTENINFSQRKRAWAFLKEAEKIAKKIEYSDGKFFDFGDFIIEFSPAVPHGSEGSKLGFVVMVMVDDGRKRVIHASDIQLLNSASKEWIIEQTPDVLITGGPPIYLEGYRVKEAWNTGLKNLNEIIKETNAKIILDHHLIRDKKYPEFFAQLEKEPLTFARYLGEEDKPLEAYRKELHKLEKGEKAEIPFGIGW